jgi:curved DNA-binding protein CbpA
LTAAFDPYRALGVRRDATDAEVKAAHRRLAKRFHPDAGGDHERFLRVQEAYKVLSNPLSRRDWDAKHAPGPLRADASGTPRRAKGATRRTTRAETPPPPASTPGEAAEAASSDDPLRRPRSRRAYTWSASEVPWWEEGVSENRRQPGRKRARATPRTKPAATGAQGAGADVPPTPDAPNAFDVYNRSSGAAWSMAARAYFRRGDQELPRRGQFHYEGTQVVTGARARTAAEAEARRRAQGRNSQRPRAASQGRHAAADAPASAAPTAGAAAAAATQPRTRGTAAGVSRDARRIHEVRESWRRRTNATTWPTLGERLLYATVAWAPIAIVIGFGATALTGCGSDGICPPYFQTAQAISIALALGLLVALPKIAYAGAFASIGALFFGLGIVALMALFGVDVPLSYEMSALLVIALVLGYIASIGIVLLRPARTRPWYAGPRP